MDELTPHPDPMVEAGRRWMRDELDSADYFAMVRRQARPVPRALRGSGGVCVRRWR
jgi:hypothetical protein